MASERPIRRKPCLYANNFESLIAFRNTYVWGGWGKAGLGKVSVVQWMQHAYSDFFLFILFLSLSLSHHNQGQKNACTRKPKFLCIFLRNASPPPTPTSPHTNGNSFKSLNTSLSSRWGEEAGLVLGPQLGTDA